jgi:hypothetical protein
MNNRIYSTNRELKAATHREALWPCRLEFADNFNSGIEEIH